MFPTIGHLINYLLHTSINVPLQTLGVFMALAFALSYVVFRSEFKRKEAEGVITPFKRNIITGAPASAAELLVNGALGFLFGFKLIGAMLNYRLFLLNPKDYILSLQGSYIAGALCFFALVWWAYADRKKHQLPQPRMEERLVHPYQLMPLIVFSVAFWGFIGAKLFDVAEHLDALRYDPVGVIFSTNGFAYLGGLIFGSLIYLYIGHKRGMKLVHLADIGSPGMMLAYAIGRIGCQLAGDGDWGIVNLSPKPFNWLPDWMWVSTYPHNLLNEGIAIKGCVGNYCNQLPVGVYPTPLYEVTTCLLLFGVMWAVRRKLKTPGLMFCLYLMMNGGERFLIEMIRVNQRYSFLGINLTQAQWLSVAIFTGGFAGLIYVLSRQKKQDVSVNAKEIELLQLSEK